jgi:hypothetical protein
MKFNLQNLKSFAVSGVLFVVLIAVMIFFLFQYLNTTDPYIETERADIEIRQNIVETYGYIFRNEEIIYSPGGYTPAGGDTPAGRAVNYLVENGDKVGKNQLIAQSSETASDFSVKDRITILDEKLDIMHKSNINLDFVTTSVDKINSDTHIIYMSMLQSIEKGKVKDAGKNRNELLILMNKKQLITGEVSSIAFESLIYSLEDNKRQLEAQIIGSGIGGVQVFSNKSGIFYSRIDGYEDYLTADELKTLDFTKFDELIKQSPDGNIINNAVGKVAYDFKWYLVCKIKKNKNIDFIDGKKYNIIYPYSSNKIIESVLSKQIDSADSGEVILIFETMAAPSDFDFSRKQAIQIISDEIKGIKVPEEALHVIKKPDGTTAEGVYILKSNVIFFRELPKEECIARFDGYYLYLEPAKRPEKGGGKLLLYEDMITAGKDLYDGKAID